MRDRDIELVSREPTQRKDGKRRVAASSAKPSHPSVRAPGCVGVGRTGSEHDEIEIQRRARSISARV
jgi:hypothetical protein